MKFWKNSNKKSVSRAGISTLAILLFFVCGLLLTIKPDMVLNVVTVALSVFLLLGGAQKTVAYFKHDAQQSREDFDFAIGLSSACFGLILLIKPEIIQSVLPVLLGMVMMVGGFAKAQLAFDLYRSGENRWWWFLIGVAVSIVLGVLSIAVPGLSAEKSTRYTGIALLVEAVLDTAALIISRRALRNTEKPVQAEAPAEPAKEA